MNAVKEPTELRVALDKREGYIDNSTDNAVELIERVMKSALDDAYEEGFEAGELQGRHDIDQEYMESGPVAELIAIVKDVQTRRPDFEPESVKWRNRYFYDSLIRFLESGELPPEWQP